MESITLENQNKLSIKDAKKVKTSTPSFAVVELENNTVSVSGSDIEVTKLDLENKEVVFSGNFSQLKFSSAREKQGLFKRIFK